MSMHLTHWRLVSLLAMATLEAGCHEEPTVADVPAADLASSDIVADQRSPDARPDVPDSTTGVPSDVAMDSGVSQSDASDAASDVLLDPDIPRSLTVRVDAAAVPSDLPYPDAADAGESVAPPRPIAPLSAMRVTSQRPTLHWELPSGVTGARVELCGDPLCRHPLIRTDVIGSSFRPELSLPPGVIFWRLAGRSDAGIGSRWSPTWEFGVRHRDTPVDSVVGALKDFNGDGFDDLAVGENDLPNIDIFEGGPAGVAETAHHIVSSDVFLAEAIVGIGDLNLDGFADLSIYGSLYFGGPSGIHAGHDVHIPMAPFPSGPSAITDTDGDGFGDMVVALANSSGSSGVFVVPGTSAGVSLTRLRHVHFDAEVDFHADRIDSANDVNGDGFGDVLIGSHFTDGRAGRVYLLLGSPGGLTSSREIRNDNPGGALGRDFGRELAGVGDLNGDGFSDFVVQGNDSVLYVYYGHREIVAAAPDVVIQEPARFQLSAGFGQSLARGGDIDGDGYGDLFTGPSCEGVKSLGEFVCTVSHSYVYYGSLAGVRTTPNVDLRGETRAGYVGYAIPGDLNADGIDDFVLGDPSTAASQISIFFGNTSRMYGAANQVITRLSPSGEFGMFMAMRLDGATLYGQGV